MTNEEIAVTLKDHDNQIRSLKHRMNEVEESNKTLNKIATSVEVMATNLEHMVEEQKAQGETLKEQSNRIERLEHEPAEDLKGYKKAIIGSIITGIIGLLLGGFFSLLFK